MSAERRARILQHLYPNGETHFDASLLGRVCARVTGTKGAGVMLMSGDLPGGSLGATDEVSALIEDLQFTLGEGPCIDAHRQRRSILEPDLARPAVMRWPVFTPPAVGAGVRAVFGFPLQVGTARLGALNLYNDRAGPLSEDQHADALVMAEVAATAVLLEQAKAPPGVLTAELERGSDLQHVVHQATGMVSAQLGVSVTQALIRLRAYAFRHDRLLGEVAQDVVARRLRFVGDGDAIGNP